MTDRPEIFVQEAHRRSHLDKGHRLVAELGRPEKRDFHDLHGVDLQKTATMSLALHSLMIGSHAYRMPLA